ncbi:MAG: PEP-CTERM sorting domain-containing protein [Bryobacteraceae bacterium]|jgi:hypothetical protein
MEQRLGFAIALVAALAGANNARATTIDLGTFLVSPEGTFLYQEESDTCAAPGATAGCNNNPTFIDLGQYIGDTISITDVGSLCVYYPTPGGTCTLYSASASYLGGVFDTNDTLLGPSNIIRLPGEVPSGLPNIDTSNLNTFTGDVNTTIPDDFYLPATIVVAAQYLVVGTLDSAYIDNSGTTPPTFGVDITVNTGSATVSDVPEPGSGSLLFAGAALLWFSRRKAFLRGKS